MPYKQNPARCERATGLCRFVMGVAQDPLNTAATQWLERTLDDSANRRIVLPEAFLALDGALDLLHSVISGLVVHEHTIRHALMAELPFMAVENVMMAAVKRGRDRQEVHEALRKHAMTSAHRVKDQGLPNDLVERMKTEPLLFGVNVDEMLDPMTYVGRAPQQVARFVQNEVASIRKGYGTRYAQLPSSEPKV